MDTHGYIDSIQNFFVCFNEAFLIRKIEFSKMSN